MTMITLFQKKKTAEAKKLQHLLLLMRVDDHHYEMTMIDLFNAAA